MIKNKNYHEWLLEKLKDHDEAAYYLHATLEESLKGRNLNAFYLLLFETLPKLKKALPI